MRKIGLVQLLSQRLLGLGMAAMLVAGTLFAGQPAGKAFAAAVCTTTGPGNLWSNAAAWNCGHVPDPADNVIITDELLIDSAQTVNNVTIKAEGAALTFTADVALTITGNLDVNGGAFASTALGSVVLAGGDQTILTHGQWVDFWNLSKTSGASLSVDPGVSDPDLGVVGGLHIVNMLTLKGASAASPLTLKSTAAGSQWQLWADGISADYDITDVQVQDSAVYSQGITPIVVLSALDLGNNSGWELQTVSIVLTRDSASPITQYLEAEFSAVVSPASVAGTVEFRDGTDIIPDCGSVALDVEGKASCSSEELSVATHKITAAFISGVNLATNIVSNEVEQIVDPNGFVLNAASFENEHQILSGDTAAVSLLAMINPMPASGTVAFQDGGATIPLCSAVAVSKGRAVCNVAMGAGAHQITTIYNSITSTPFVQLIQKTSAVATTSLNPAKADFTKPITFKAEVTNIAGAVGTVTFRNNGLNIIGCINLPVVDNTASCTIAKPQTGTYAITAFYSGDANSFIASSQSNPAIQQLVDAFYYFPFLHIR
jgi:hypothetical protein